MHGGFKSHLEKKSLRIPFLYGLLRNSIGNQTEICRDFFLYLPNYAQHFFLLPIQNDGEGEEVVEKNSFKSDGNYIRNQTNPKIYGNHLTLYLK